MSGVVFGVVLIAAALHASWNALAKAIPDPRVAAGQLAVAGLVGGAAGVVLFPALVLATSAALTGRGFVVAMRRSARLGLFAGVLAMVAYAIVLWAQSRAPLPLVSALRETSLLFAGVIGTLVFREPFRVTRLVATAAAVAGIVLLQTS